MAFNEKFNSLCNLTISLSNYERRKVSGATKKNPTFATQRQTPHVPGYIKMTRVENLNPQPLIMSKWLSMKLKSYLAKKKNDGMECAQSPHS